MNENQFAGLLGVTLPVLLGLLLAGAGASAVARRLRPVLALAATALALYLAGPVARSWGGTAALLMALAAFGVLWRRRTPALRPVPAAMGLAAAVVAVSVILALLAPAPWLTGRILPWRGALTLFQGSPVFGTGPGSYPAFRVLADHGDTLGKSYVAYLAHNTWLQVLAEAGLFALALVGATALRYRRALVTTVRGSAERALAAGLLAALLFALLHAGIDYAMQVPATALILAVEVGCLASMLERPVALRTSPAESPLTRAVVVLAGTAVLLASVAGCRQERALRQLRAAAASHLALAGPLHSPRKTVSPESAATSRERVAAAMARVRSEAAPAWSGFWLGQASLGAGTPTAVRSAVRSLRARLRAAPGDRFAAAMLADARSGP